MSERRKRWLDVPRARGYGLGGMRLVRLVIWVATLFFAVMLFFPLIRQIVRQLSESGGPLGP